MFGHRRYMYKWKENLFHHQDFIFLKRSYISRIIEKLSKQNFFIPVLNFLD